MIKLERIKDDLRQKHSKYIFVGPSSTDMKVTDTKWNQTELELTPTNTTPTQTSFLSALARCASIKQEKTFSALKRASLELKTRPQTGRTFYLETVLPRSSTIKLFSFSQH